MATVGIPGTEHEITPKQIGQMQVGLYLGALDAAERSLAEAFTMVAHRHEGDAGVRDTTSHLAEWSRRHAASLVPWIGRFGRVDSPDPARLRAALFQDARVGGLGLLRDLQDLMQLVGQVHTLWTILDTAAKGLHDRPMHEWCATCLDETERQRMWLETQIKSHAPQALTVAPVRTSELRASLPKTPTGAAAMTWRPGTLSRALTYAAATTAGALVGRLLRRR